MGLHKWELRLKYLSALHAGHNCSSRTYLNRVAQRLGLFQMYLELSSHWTFDSFRYSIKQSWALPGRPSEAILDFEGLISGWMGRGAGGGPRTWVRSSWLLLSALWYSRSVWCSSFSISRTCRLQLRSSRSNFSTFRLSWASSGSGEGGGDGDNEGGGASEAMGSGAKRPAGAEGLRSSWDGRRRTQKPRERAGSERRPHPRPAAAARGHEALKLVTCSRGELRPASKGTENGPSPPGFETVKLYW